MANNLPQARLPISEDGTTFSLPWLRFFQGLSSGSIDPALIAALEAEIASAEAAAAAATAIANEALAAANEAEAGISPAYGISFAALDEPFTKISLSVPSILSVAGSPVYSVGTLALSLTNQTANTVFAGPASGGAAVPAFRALVVADLPLVTPAKGGTGVANTGNLTWNAAQTFSFTASQTMTFPTTSATLARTDAAQSFTGTQTFAGSIKVSGDTTGAGSVLGFGTNSPATTLTGPYTWVTLISSDGSTVYLPAYK